MEMSPACGIWVILHIILCWMWSAMIVFTVNLISALTFVDPEWYQPLVQLILHHQYL